MRDASEAVVTANATDQVYLLAAVRDPDAYQYFPPTVRACLARLEQAEARLEAMQDAGRRSARGKRQLENDGNAAGQSPHN